MRSHVQLRRVQEEASDGEPVVAGDVQVAQSIAERLCASGLVSNQIGAEMLHELVWGEMTPSLWTQYATMSSQIGEQRANGTA